MNTPITTATGAEVEIHSVPGSTLIACRSTCGTCLTFWDHLSDNHAAEARGYANGHAGACTAQPVDGAQ